MEETSAWFALRVAPRHEKKVVQTLAAKGFDAFVPLRTVRHQWSDRTKKVQEPIFSGYVYCRFGSNERSRVLGSFAGIDNSRVISVPDPEIAALRKLSSAEMDISPRAYVPSGETTMIDRGPLAGFEVYAVESNGVIEYIKSFHTLQQSCAIPTDH